MTLPSCSDGAIHCELADGERVTVLVSEGEPKLVSRGADAQLAVIRSDGTIVLEQVKRARVSSTSVRHAARRARRLSLGWDR